MLLFVTLISLLRLIPSVVSLVTVPEDSVDDTDQWGEAHVRKSTEALVLLPSSGDDDGDASEKAFRLADIPLNDNWGFVEINSKTDLQAAEGSRINLSNNKSTEVWRTQNPVSLVDDRLYTGGVVNDNNDGPDWSWSVAAQYNQDSIQKTSPSDTINQVQFDNNIQYHPQSTSYQVPNIVRSDPPPPPSAPLPPTTPSPSVTTTPLSLNPFTRLKQKLSKMPSIGSLAETIGSSWSKVTSRDGTETESEKGSSLSMSQIRDDIKTALGLPKTLTPIDWSKALTLTNPTSNSPPSQPSSSYSQPSPPLNIYHQPSGQTYHQPSPPVSSSSYGHQSEENISYNTETVTPGPNLIPVPTYMPINRDLLPQVPAGFQVLLQYIVAIVGMALILAI